ncbi:MAG: ribosome recycling factor [Oligosphaeraceae bacterium]|nr:ribosome recycling factor [Oligosphaeraceae bacterium]
MSEVKQIMKQAEAAMQRAVDMMQKSFAAVRTGKASPALVEGLMVEYYGTQTRLKDIASITAPEPRLLVIQPWDQGAMKSIEKAIQTSDLGISPVSDGRVVRLPIPELSEERRKDMSRLVRKRAEEARIEVRNARRDANEALKKAEKSSVVTEDELKTETDNVQKLTDKNIDQINKLLEEKEAELMEV